MRSAEGRVAGRSLILAATPAQRTTSWPSAPRAPSRRPRSSTPPSATITAPSSPPCARRTGRAPPAGSTACATGRCTISPAPCSTPCRARRGSSWRRLPTCSPARPSCRRRATSPAWPARAAPRTCPLCPRRSAWSASPASRAASGRARSAATRSPTRLEPLIQPLIRDDQPFEAESLLNTRIAELSDEARTAFQQRIAWVYFLNGNDRDARRLADLARRGPTEYALHAEWVAGLAAWRMGDYAAAAEHFGNVAARSSDIELAAAGHYWAARADTAGGRPERVQARLQDRGAARARPSTACSPRARSASASRRPT